MKRLNHVQPPLTCALPHHFCTLTIPHHPPNMSIPDTTLLIQLARILAGVSMRILCNTALLIDLACAMHLQYVTEFTVGKPFQIAHWKL